MAKDPSDQGPSNGTPNRLPLGIGIGVALGAGVGTAIGAALGCLGVGIGVGAGVGLALGIAFVLRKRHTLAGMALGTILGLIAAPVCGAMLGLVFGAPWFTEPGPWVAPGLEGAGFGALVYGVLGCIPTALVGAIVGGVVAARRDAGSPGNSEQPAPADRPRE